MGLLSKLFGGAPAVLPTHVETSAEFREHVLTHDTPVIVNVWSPTCAPCRKLVPVLEGVASRYDGRVKVVELNSHAADPALIRRLGVKSTPTLIIYEDGQEYGRMVGFRPRGWFDEMIATEFPEARAS